MEVQIHSDGQLYPPKPPRPKPAPAPKPPPPPMPSKDPPWEDLLIVGVALLILRNCDRPDLPLLLALCYILFDQQFDLKKLF